jgi:DNA-binding YbaB/EbfC family protein
MAKGFKAPKGGGQAGMMQQLQKLQEQLLEAQNKLADEIVSGTSGGGAVKISVTGDQRCTQVDIDVEMLQDLIMAAMNTALEESRNLAAERLGPLTGGLPF